MAKVGEAVREHAGDAAVRQDRATYDLAGLYLQRELVVTERLSLLEHTGPWLMLVGLLFGVAAGFKGLIRTANQVHARSREESC
mgnify:CR=1 FL=1